MAADTCHEDAGEFNESSRMIRGSHAALMVQSRHNDTPQLTLSVMDIEQLARLQNHRRDFVTILNVIGTTDIFLAAINMIQASAMVLNINAFMAAMCSVVPHPDRPRITAALNDLFKELGVETPAAELQAILLCCKR